MHAEAEAELRLKGSRRLNLLAPAALPAGAGLAIEAETEAPARLLGGGNLQAVDGGQLILVADLLQQAALPLTDVDDVSRRLLPGRKLLQDRCIEVRYFTHVHPP